MQFFLYNKKYTPLGQLRRARDGTTANDVSLLWRHWSWIRSCRLERAYRRSFFTFVGKC